MSIDDLKLRTKTLIPLAAMALVILAMVSFGALKLIGISDQASEIIEHRDVAASQLIRASRAMLTAPYDVLAALVFDGDTAQGRAASEGFPKAIADVDSILDEAMRLVPDKAAEIA